MHRQEEILFEAMDYEGTPVVLSRTTWQAKVGNDEVGAHPEIRSYQQDVKVTFGSSALVFQSTRDERSYVFTDFRLDVMTLRVSISWWS